MHILHVVGARPNLMKVAPVLSALKHYPKIKQTLIHTGQHYDTNMSDVFFQQLEIPAPDVNLGVGSGSHARQTADIMTRFEPVVLERKPDLVLVYGDVNSTVAAALVCSKLLIQVGHVEAGLRSFDRTMPEEINRLVTDQLADLLFTPSEDGDKNLEREGIPASKIHLVGNVMIDSLVRLLPVAMEKKLNGLPDRYVLVTLHRPANVDDDRTLKGILECLLELNSQLKVVFPVHPRTRQRIADFGFDASQLDLRGTAALHRVPGAAAPRYGGSHRLWRHPGRNHIPESAVPHLAQQHGTSRDRDHGDEHSGWAGRSQAAL